MDTNRIEKRIELRAPLARVWRALTNAEEFGRWFRAKLEGPFEEGRPVRGHVTYPGYEHLVFEVVVKTMEAERLFAFEWHPAAIDPSVDYSKEPRTLVTFELSATPTGTRLVVTESGFDQLPPGRRQDAFRMNDGGWSIQMTNVEQYLAERP